MVIRKIKQPRVLGTTILIVMIKGIKNTVLIVISIKIIKRKLKKDKTEMRSTDSSDL